MTLLSLHFKEGAIEVKRNAQRRVKVPNVGKIEPKHAKAILKLKCLQHLLGTQESISNKQGLRGLQPLKPFSIRSFRMEN